MTSVLVSGRVYDRQVGGNTRYVRSVYDAIADHGIEVSIARPLLGNARGPIRSVAYAAAESLVWPTLTREIDVLHFPADTGAIVRGKLPIVATIHGLATLHVDGVRSRHLDRLWRRRVRRLGEVADRIITVSDSSARDIASFIPNTVSKIRVICHGIDHVQFRPNPDPGEEAALTEAGFPEKYFLYVGNIDPRKNLVELARAGSHVFSLTGTPLAIVGAPAWGSDAILPVIRALPGVLHLGRLPDDVITAAMRHTTAFCFPSTYEGFGFPVIEAMACGAPVICSNRGSLAEVAGDAAHLLDEIDAHSIARAMLDVERDVAMQKDLRQAGIANARRFQWDTSRAAHAEVLREVAP